MIQGVVKPFAPRPLLRLDWKAYYERFRELHGEPMLVGGRQLFPDGWQYSLTNYGGPEWPPPDDPAQLQTLQVAYWRARRRQAVKERDWLGHQLDGLRELQRAKNAPLQQRSAWQEDIGGVVSTVRGTVDVKLDDHEARLAWLEEDVVQCDRELSALGASDKELSDG